MKFPLYGVVYYYDTGAGTKTETTSLVRPWLYRSDPGAQEVAREALRVWPTINFRDDTRARRLLRIEVTRKEDAAWALWWFSHVTFRAGRTDEELRESFERFVTKHEPYQDEPGYQCLMGAEDRWRWKPFCECEGCRMNDFALIAH